MNRRQSGATLVVALVMLVLMMLLSVTAFRLHKGNLQMVANTQQRNQVATAAQSAIEQTISSTQFANTPSAAISNPCNGVANTTCVDVNGDGTPDVTVAVTPTCVAQHVIPVASLDFTKPDDAGCLIGTSQDFGVAGAATNNSLCADTLWDVQAVASDNITKTKYQINQGANIRVAATTTCP
jgi:Tfp pilus assembly protein PilX